MTCLEPDLFDRLNSQIAHVQIKQLRQEFAPVLTEEVSLALIQVRLGLRQVKGLTIICNPDRIAAITAQSEAICQRAWEIAFVASIRLYCEDKHLWTISSSKSCLKLEATRSFAQEGENMTVEAPEKTATTTATTKQSDRPKKSPNSSASRPSTLEKQITTLASRTGKSQLQIFAGILNEIPEILVIKGLEKLIDQEIETEVDAFRRSKRSEFLGTPGNTSSNTSSNGSRTKAKPAKSSRRTPTAASTANSNINQARFKSFTKGARISTTLINFLAAQRYDAVKREEVMQAIATLPVTAHPEMAESFPERCLSKILKVHRGGDRASVIAAAMKLGSKSAKSESQTEPAEATP